MTERCPPQCAFRPTPGAPPSCSEAMFRALVENSPDVVVRYDAEGRRLYANAAWRRLTGIPRDAALGKTIGEQPVMADPDAYRERLARALTGRPGELRVEVDSPIQGRRLFDARFIPEEGDGGRPAGVLVIGRDVTEQERIARAEARLARSRAELRERVAFQETLLRALSDVGLQQMVIEEGRIVHVGNRALAREFGFSDAAIDARPPLESILHPDDRERVLDHHRRRIAGEAVPDTYELALTTLAGERREYEVAVAAVPGSEPARVITIGRDITQRKRNERELALLKRAVEQSAEAFFVQNEHDRFVLVNEAACRSLGYPREELLGRTPLDVDPDITAERLEELKRAPAGSSGTFESRHRAKDGRIFPVEITGANFEMDGARYSVVAVRDISERKRAERMLRQREREFRALAEHLPEPVIRYAPDGRRRYVNPAFEAFFGIPAEEALGRTVAEHSSLDDPEGYQANVLAAAAGESRDFEVVTRAFGSPRTYRMHLVPEADDGGEVTGVLAIGHDLTEIIDAQARSSRFFANVPGFAFTFRMGADGHAAFPFASPGIEALYGLKPEAVKEDMAPLHALAHPDDRPRIEAALAETARTLEPFQIEFRIQRPEGGERWIECRSLPESNADGAMLWHGIMLDITERKAAQQRMERLERAVDLSSEPVYLIDDRLRFAYVNAAASRVLGYAPEALLAMGPDDIDPDSTPGEGARIMAEAPLGETFVLERRHRTREGHLLDVEISATHFEENGRKFSICVARDVTERKRIDATLRFIADPGGDGDFLAALARRLGEALNVDYVVIDRIADEPGFAETVALYAHGEIAPNLRYALRGTPCDNVVAKRDCCYPREVRALFPEDALLVEMGVESYAGIPLWDSTGRPLGLIAVMDAAPIQDQAAVLQTLRLAAPRAAAELERAASDRRLREREREFRNLAENLPDNVARWDRAGRIRYSNPVHQRTLGKPVAEMLGRTHDELFPDGRFSAFNPVIASIVASGEGTTLTHVPVPAEDGDTHFHDVKLVPEFDADGRVIGVLGIGRDMTDRYRMQQALAEREQAFRSLAENLPDNIIRWDTNGRYLYINPTHEHTLGATLSEVAGTPIPDSHTAVKAAIAQVVATGKAVHAVRQPVVVDGAEELHDVSVVPELDAKGRVTAVLGLGRDMTDLYRMQQDLADREQAFRSLAESSPDFIIRVDRERRIRYINDALVRFEGFDGAEQLIGKRRGEIWGDDRFAAIEAAEAAAVAAGETQTIEIAYSGADGEPGHHHIRVVPERDAAGEIIGTIIFGRDVTAIREGERRLKHFIDNLPGLAYTFRLTPDGAMSFPFVSPGVEPIYGIAPEQAMADVMAIHGRAHPDDRPRIEAAIAESARNLTPFRLESRVLVPGRPERWLDVRSIPSREADGATLWHGIMLDITERKWAEGEMRRSEQLLRDVIDATPDWIFVKDREHRYRLANKGYADALHLAPEAFIGKDDLELGFPEAQVKGDPEQGIRGFWADDRRVLESNQTQVFPDDPATIDGEVHTFHTIKVPLRDADGGCWGVLAFARDISERKAIEEQLNHERAILRTYFDALPALAWMKDGNGRYLACNPLLETLFGAPGEEILGKTDFDFVDRELAAFFREKDLEAMAADGPRVNEEWVTFAGDGRRALLETVKAPVRDAEGGTLGVIGIAHDITERKRREAETRRLIEIIEASVDFIGTANLEGRLTYHNRAARRMVGLPEEADLSAMEIADFHPEWAMRLIEETALPAVREHGTWRGESAVRHRDGREIPVSQLVMLHRDETGAPLFLSTIIQDISERKAAETAREAALDEALRLAHARAAFLSQMSHELRTPMNSVLGFAQLLREDAGLGGEARERVELILKSGDHLLGLINDVLDFAKIEADRIELDPGEIELAPFLATVTAIVRVRAEEKRLAFVASVEPGLPENLHGDELRLRQVLLNLLGNAVKFTDRGRVELRASRPVPERIRFEVRDSGVGIDADRLAAIFDPFEQAGDRRRAAQGTGLGLAISRRLVRLMGGEIEVESRPGEGSRFAFELPLDAAAPPAKPAVIGAAPAQANAPEEAPSDAAPSTDTAYPPAEELEELLQLARRGNPRGVARRAAALADGEPRQRPFADRLAAMARAYDTRAMETYLQQVLQQEPAP